MIYLCTFISLLSLAGIVLIYIRFTKVDDKKPEPSQTIEEIGVPDFGGYISEAEEVEE